jgi:deoxyribodipyrimidine photolyase-related protein
VVKPQLILILGDQLTPGLSALAAGDPARDVVVMAEVAGEASYVPHHPKKIAFLFAAMRKFAAELREAGWRVAYSRLDGPDNAGSIPGELLRRAGEHGAAEVIATQPGEHRLHAVLEDLPLKTLILNDDRFLCSPGAFAAWAKGRKELRMEWFYRAMRRQTGLLMEDGKPEGGKWNYDAENRKPASANLLRAGPLRFDPDAVTQEVLDLVADRFADRFGRLEPFWFATDRAGAEAARDHFLTQGLPGFGDTQDAMLTGDRFLNHAVLSMYLNAGLLDPLDLCRRAEAEYRAGRAPLNAVEGFIRQIIGWREYIRGIYFLQGPGYTASNALGADRPLPAFYWGAPTDMACIAAVVEQTRDEAYAHHIQRLMVTGNFALLAGLDPAAVHEWYLSVYADAYEWVEAPNTLGMALYADGGVVASKPYAASGAYIDRMSDYCRGCAYDVKAKTGDRACPFNLLYWDFLIRHRQRFQSNPRMAVIYRNWDRMAEDRRRATLDGAAAFLSRLDGARPQK